MKKILILLALFPFLHATSYQAELVSCQQDELIIKSQGQELQVSLFNVKIKESAGWNKTCDLLENAKSITFEVDPSSAVKDPLPVYLFADDDLVQEVLLKQKLAFLQIKNPEYTYEKQLEEAVETTQVVAEPAPKEETTGFAKNAPLFLAALVAIWAGMLYLMLRKKKQKNKK